MMKKNFGLLLIFFLILALGLWLADKEKTNLEYDFSAPVFSEKNAPPIGWAFPIKNDLWFVPDHLLGASENLFIHGKKVEIWKRFSDEDIAFVITEKSAKNLLEIFFRPPVPGDEIKNFSSKSTHILSTSVNFLVRGQDKKNLFVFSGKAKKGDSGRPVFSATDSVLLGFLVGVDESSQKIFAVSAEKVWDYAGAGNSK